MSGRVRVLILCRGYEAVGENGQKAWFAPRSDGTDGVVVSPYVREQIDSLERLGITVELSVVHGRGVLGYIRHLPQLYRDITRSECDLVHAHYGLCGGIAALQSRRPFVVTFHGSDANLRRLRGVSKFVCRRANHVICVEPKIPEMLGLSEKYSVIPCGVDLSTFFPLDKADCRQKLGIRPEQKLILFGSSFERPVKNGALAVEAAKKIPNAELRELKGLAREDVNLLLNAADVLLLTSFREGSPQVIKEGLACGVPIVTTVVGDVKELIGDTPGCFYTSFEANDVAAKLELAFDFRGRTAGREKIARLDLKNVASRINTIYQEVQAV